MRKSSEKVICKNCRAKVSGKFCSECGQKLLTERLTWYTLLEESTNAIFNISKAIKITFHSMITEPGENIYSYLNGTRTKYQSPISYFLGSFIIYQFLGKIYISNKWYIGTILPYSIYELAALMFGLAVIGWLISGLPRFRLVEVFVLFCYVYGTSFTISSIVTIAQIPFLDDLNKIPHWLRVILLDIPTGCYIYWSIFKFFQVADISFKRYFLNAILGFVYYYGLVQFLQHYRA